MDAASVIDGDAGVRVADMSEAAFVVDPIATCIVTGNAAAARAWGLGSVDGVLLDAATPAIPTLSALAAAGWRRHEETHSLVFWTPRGPQVWRCLVREVTGTERPLVLVRLSEGSDRILASETPKARDDLSTLAEIARRIREGRLGAAMTDQQSPAPTADMVKPAPIAASAAIPPTRLRPPPLDFQLPASFPAAPSIGATAESAEPMSGQRARDQILATLAHELRTPLSAIVSMAEIMRDERLGPMSNARYKTYAGDIHDSARHTLDLITSTLSEARTGSQTAAPKLDFTGVNLNELIRSCSSAMEPIAARAGITIAAELVAEAPLVIADRRSLRQIILNLLSNALRFTAKDGTVRLTTSATDDGRVRLDVRDNGAGMSQDEISGVLAGRPSTASRTTRAAGHVPGDTGSGFGLPLVRRLVLAHEAELLFDSQPGHGTCASVIFPKHRVVSE